MSFKSMLNEATVWDTKNHKPGERFKLGNKQPTYAEKLVLDKFKDTNQEFELQQFNNSKTLERLYFLPNGEEGYHKDKGKYDAQTVTVKAVGSNTEYNFVVHNAMIFGWCGGGLPQIAYEVQAIASIYGIRDISQFESFLKNKELNTDQIKNFKLTDQTKTVIKDILTNTKFDYGTPSDFIHKDINTFYNKLLQYEGLERIKANTSDVAFIFNADKKKLFKALDNKWNASVNEDNGIVTLINPDGTDSISFIQVSLKLGKTKARWGKNTTFLFSIIDGNVIYESWLPDEIPLNEGFGSFVKNAAILAKDITVKYYNSVIAQAKRALNFLRNILSKNKLENEQEKYTKTLLKRLPTLNENIKISATPNKEYFSILKEEYDRNYNKFIKNVNSKIKDGIEFLEISPTEIQSIPSGKSDLNLYACNQISMYMMDQLTTAIQKAGVYNHIKEQIEMTRKGSTKLPVVVVYSDGTQSDIISQQPSFEHIEDFPAVIFTKHLSVCKCFYVISMYFIVEEGETEPLYIKSQFTNDQGATRVRWKSDVQPYFYTLKQIRSL